VKPIAGFALAAALLVPAPAFAHRLDEYLQATLISVDKDRVHGEIRLAPGAFIWKRVLHLIDTDSDGIISDAEQRAYASRVLGDLMLTVDGQRLPLVLVSVQSASVEFLREGMGDIRIDFDAVAPAGNGNRRLTFENHHQRGMSVYLVNSLVPSDSNILIVAQHRNHNQSSYQLDYEQRSITVGQDNLAALKNVRASPTRAVILVSLALLSLSIVGLLGTRYVNSQLS